MKGRCGAVQRCGSGWPLTFSSDRHVSRKSREPPPNPQTRTHHPVVFRRSAQLSLPGRIPLELLLGLLPTPMPI
jgi:hypothetical protein